MQKEFTEGYKNNLQKGIKIICRIIIATSMERYMGELSNKTDFEFKASLLLLLYNRNISNYYPRIPN